MGGTTRIATGGTTTDITMADTTLCTGVGLRAFMVALAIIAIGKESPAISLYSILSAPPVAVGLGSLRPIR